MFFCCELFNGGKSTSQLLKILDLCIMRHKKDQTFNGQQLVELPPRQEQYIELDMNNREQDLYNKLFAISKRK